MALQTLSRERLNRATLARQMLLAREELDPPEAVARLAGLQAQEPKPPFIGLWSRLAGFERAELIGALRSRTVVRATLMRATLHLLDPAGYLTMRACLQPMLDASMKSALRDRSQGLDLDRLLPAARELLAERPRAFDELREDLSQRFPEMNDRAIGYAIRTQIPLVMVASEDRWGFPRGSQFALAEEWLGEPVDQEAGLGPIIRRYLGAFGPASAADFGRWSGLNGAKAAFEELREELFACRDERGRALFDLPDSPRPDAAEAAPARLLPEFDNLMLAHDDRSRVVADEHRKGLVTKNLRVKATFLVDGFAAGTWRIERKGKRATLAMMPFEPLPKRARAGLAEEAAALLAFAEPEASATDVSFAEPGSA